MARSIECVHDGYVGGPKQYNDSPLGNIFYFHANIFYCFSPPTWPPCTHSIPFVLSLPEPHSLEVKELVSCKNAIPVEAREQER